MKTKLKLGFADTHDHLASFFYYVLSDRYSIEIDNESPQVLIFGDDNFGTTNTKFKRGGDTIKIFYTGENRRPENFDCDYAISFDYNFNAWHYRLPLFVVYMWAMEHIHKMKYPYEHIFRQDIKPAEKTGFASFVVSNPNCKERNKFFEMLNEYKKVDAGGKLYNNVGGVVEGEQGKIDFLSSRKFNICFEPYTHPGYVTEKILHAFYARTVPIYWGSPTIGNDFNPRAFINVHGFRTFEDCIETIKEIDNNDDFYNSIASQPTFMYNIPPSYVILDNLKNWFDAAINKKIKARDEDTYLRV